MIFWGSFFAKASSAQWGGKKFKKICIFPRRRRVPKRRNFYIPLYLLLPLRWHEICWWVCKLHMFLDENFSARRERKSLSCHLPSSFLHICTSSSSSEFTTSRLHATKKSHFFFSRITFLFISPIPFSPGDFCRERKIRAERPSQYLVFRQTWSTHNRDKSWKYF